MTTITEQNKDSDQSDKELSKNGSLESNNADVSIKETSDDIEKIKEERDFHLKQRQYAQAELVNYRKQVSKEFENQSKFGNSQIIQYLIEIYEDLKRIIDNSNSDDSSLKGLTLIIKNIESMFKEQSVEIINSVGNPFDPNLHEAIEYTENSDIDDNVVISEIQSGYKIHGQVLRPSKVNVCKNKSVNSGVDINE
ncbi:MAG: nucleotide exchange factor GrpE [Nitrososphaerales archaeon]|mgnify:FL=1|nr:nucleotide exchange factor GrpE [Nitrososphaerales archaeon]